MSRTRRRVTRGVFLLSVAVLAMVPMVRAALIGRGDEQRGRTISYSGYLEEGGRPVTGATRIGFALSTEDGSALWTFDPGDSPNVAVQGGRFTVELGGEGMPELPDSVFRTPEVFLSTRVNGVSLEGRQRIGTARHAVHAQEAASAVGMLDVRIAEAEALADRIHSSPNILRIDDHQMCWGTTPRLAVSAGSRLTNVDVEFPDGCVFLDNESYTVTASMNDNYGNNTGILAYAYRVDERSIQIRMAPQDDRGNGPGFAQAQYIVIGRWR